MGIRKWSSFILLHVTIPGYKKVIQFHSFACEYPSFPNTIYWRNCHFSIVYSCLLSHRLIDHISIHSFLGSLSCSIDLCVCFCSIIILFFICLFVFFLFIYLFLAVLCLRFCVRAFSSCGKRGPLFIAVRRPLTIAASRCRAQAPDAQAQ